VKRSRSSGDAAVNAPAGTLAQLLQCLQAEGEALSGGDVDRLAQAVHQKELTLRRLAAELAGIDRVELRRAVRSLRDLNERNARLLAPHMHINRVRIESLFGAARTGALYSSDGRAAGPRDRPAQRGVRA